VRCGYDSCRLNSRTLAGLPEGVNDAGAPARGHGRRLRRFACDEPLARENAGKIRGPRSRRRRLPGSWRMPRMRGPNLGSPNRPCAGPSDSFALDRGISPTPADHESLREHFSVFDFFVAAGPESRGVRDPSGQEHRVQPRSSHPRRHGRGGWRSPAASNAVPRIRSRRGSRRPPVRRNDTPTSAPGRPGAGSAPPSSRSRAP